MIEPRIVKDKHWELTPELVKEYRDHWADRGKGNMVLPSLAIAIAEDWLSLARRASKLEGALRIAEQYVRSRHNEGNPSCCTCDSKSPRGVCKDLVQIREALAPEDR